LLPALELEHDMRSFQKLVVVAIVPVASFAVVVGVQAYMAWLVIAAAAVLLVGVALWAMLRWAFDEDRRDVLDERPSVVLLRPFRQDAERRYHDLPPAWVSFARVDVLVIALLFGLYRAWDRYDLDRLMPTTLTAIAALAYVVYVMVASAWWYRRERPYIDALSAELRRSVGPPLALTSRHAGRSRGGPSYVRTADSTWKTVVIGLLTRSQFATVLLGESEGLAWELGLLRRHGCARRLFVITDPKAMREVWSYDRIRRAFAAAGWCLPLDPPRLGSVSILDDEFRCWVVAEDLPDAKSVAEIVAREARAVVDAGGGTSTVLSSMPSEPSLPSPASATARHPRAHWARRTLVRALRDAEGLMAALTGALVIGFGTWLLFEQYPREHVLLGTGVLGVGLVLVMLLSYQAIVEIRSDGEAPLDSDYFDFFDAFAACFLVRAIFLVSTLLDHVAMGTSPILLVIEASMVYLYLRLANATVGRHEEVMAVTGCCIGLEVARVLVSLFVGELDAILLVSTCVAMILAGCACTVFIARQSELRDPRKYQ
jgi:hypothetical protein